MPASSTMNRQFHKLHWTTDRTYYRSDPCRDGARGGRPRGPQRGSATPARARWLRPGLDGAHGCRPVLANQSIVTTLRPSAHYIILSSIAAAAAGMGFSRSKSHAARESAKWIDSNFGATTPIPQRGILSAESSMSNPSKRGLGIGIPYQRQKRSIQVVRRIAAPAQFTGSTRAAAAGEREGKASLIWRAH